MCCMLGIEPKDEFRQYRTMTVIETTHGSLQIHIPSKVAKNLLLRKGQRLECYANAKTKTIQYRLVEE